MAMANLTELECRHLKAQSSDKGLAMVDRAHSVLLWRKEHSLLSVDDLAQMASLHLKRVETFVGSA